VKPCGGCERRAAALNRLLVFSGGHPKGGRKSEERNINNQLRTNIRNIMPNNIYPEEWID
jgi:hypothetical protein